MGTAVLDRITGEEAADRLMANLRPDARPSWWHTPLSFVKQAIRWPQGQGPTPYQEQVLREFPERRRACLRSPHSAGKTALAAWIVLWFALSREGMAGDWKAVLTASAWRQLSHYLLPEIRKWAGRLDWPRIGRPAFDQRTELLALNLKLSRGEAFAAASDKPELIEGAHADHLLYVFDEAKAIPTATWDAAEGALSSGDCLALAISTPGEPHGRFYDIQARKQGTEDWWVRHVTRDECLEAGRMDAAWAEQRALLWGERSAVYQNRVLGEFATSEADGIIPLTWVEAANARWESLEASGEWGDLSCVGVDVARSGEDKTVLALRHGEAIRELRRTSREDTMETTGHVVAALGMDGAYAMVDVIGIGAGVVDRLREQTLDVRPFNAGAGTDWRDASNELQFANLRSAAWWNMRELLDPAQGHEVALPPDDLLTGDLTAPHWRANSTGKVVLESKDEIKKRLGRSTDDGDAVVMAFWREPDPDTSLIQGFGLAVMAD